jgi:predicted PurR-regulated permease PerM
VIYLDLIKKLFEKEIVRSILFILGVSIFLYVIKSILDLVLLTFIFAFLINSLENLVINRFNKYVPIKKGLVVAIVYVIIFAILFLVLYNYVPLLIVQIKSTIFQAQSYYANKTNSNIPIWVRKYIDAIIQKVDIKNYTQSGVDIAFKTATSIGKWSENVALALLLSLFFSLEKDRVVNFLTKFEDSKVSGIYKYFKFFGKNFLNSFGKVINAQVVIAIVNTSISVVFLAILGFPKLLAIGFMIFILSLIPVAGVIISLIPLSLIAFNIGGLIKVLYVLIMVAVIHCIESYFLNPKLMSENTKLPIFFTFVVLIFSEHFMGIWGLLLGIPLFMFFIEVLGVKISQDKERT